MDATPTGSPLPEPEESGFVPAVEGAGEEYRPRRRDRRVEPTPRFSRYSMFGGRRRGPRRETEKEGSFVDLYSKRLWVLIFWVALMNLLDSYFTLVHLQAGGVEINPVADALLQTGRMGFVMTKSMLIGAALLVLCLHKNYPLAKLGLFASAGIYTLLVGYHLSLFTVA